MTAIPTCAVISYSVFMKKRVDASHSRTPVGSAIWSIFHPQVVLADCQDMTKELLGTDAPTLQVNEEEVEHPSEWDLFFIFFRNYKFDVP